MADQILSVPEFVQELNASGCDINEDQYREFLRALTRFEVQQELQSIKRYDRKGIENNSTELVETLVDPEQPIRLKKLRAALNRHLNLSHTLQREPEQLEPEPAHHPM